MAPSRETLGYLTTCHICILKSKPRDQYSWPSTKRTQSDEGDSTKWSWWALLLKTSMNLPTSPLTSKCVYSSLSWFHANCLSGYFATPRTTKWGLDHSNNSKSCSAYSKAFFVFFKTFVPFQLFSIRLHSMEDNYINVSWIPTIIISHGNWHLCHGWSMLLLLIIVFFVRMRKYLLLKTWSYIAKPRTRILKNNKSPTRVQHQGRAL